MTLISAYGPFYLVKWNIFFISPPTSHGRSFWWRGPASSRAACFLLADWLIKWRLPLFSMLIGCSFLNAHWLGFLPHQLLVGCPNCSMAIGRLFLLKGYLCLDFIPFRNNSCNKFFFILRKFNNSSYDGWVYMWNLKKIIFVYSFYPHFNWVVPFLRSYWSVLPFSLPIGGSIDWLCVLLC